MIIANLPAGDYMVTSPLLAKRQSKLGTRAKHPQISLNPSPIRFVRLNHRRDEKSATFQ